MPDIILRSKLDGELLDVGFLLATQKQIAKDFFSVNTTFINSFEQEVRNIDELMDQVSMNLSRQLELGERETLQLMYRIDIPENEFLELSTRKEFLIQLSQRIMYREAYKIYLRREYSS